MKKIFFAFLLILGLVATAHAAEQKPIPGLTIKQAFPALERAARGTSLVFNEEDAEASCKVACSAVAPVGKDCQVVVTYQRGKGEVTAVMLLVQVAYPEKVQVAEGMLRAIEAVKVLGRLIKPKISDADLQKIQQRVGITAKGLVQGTPGEMIYNGIQLNGVFLGGIYMLSASGA